MNKYFAHIKDSNIRKHQSAILIYIFYCCYRLVHAFRYKAKETTTGKETTGKAKTNKPNTKNTCSADVRLRGLDSGRDLSCSVCGTITQCVRGL